MYDWHQFQREETVKPAVVDPRRRARICLAVFGLLLIIIFARAVQLELTYGAAYRTEAIKPIEKERPVLGLRGKILARDGTVLACDRELLSLAMQYRYLQNPPDAKWLKSAARARLSKTERSKPARVAEEQNRVLAERLESARRLAKLCGMTHEEWTARAARIQNRVEKITAEANARHEQMVDGPAEPEQDGFAAWLARSLKDPQTPEKITVAEELDCHVLCDDPPPAAVAQIENRKQDFPGVIIVKQTRRFYPLGKSASNVLGYLGLERENEWIGKIGLEKSCETALRGRLGTAVDIVQHNGRVVSSSYRRKPENGQDITLTLDAELQRSAEDLLDSAMERRLLSHPEIVSAGGAVVVMDLTDGSLRALASVPRFDPNLFVADRPGDVAALLDDPGHPLFDRACRMAIPPGSVFKIVTAIALLESGGVDPEEPFFCQGYLERPEAERCEIFVEQGIGHGETTLSDALCRSCNVYFFHHAGRRGPDPLIDWAERLGFGHVTGVDLLGEAAGTVPNPENIERLEHHAWKTTDTHALSVGQGSLTATPLQIACLMAAVANDGSLVQPHVKARRVGSAHQVRRVGSAHQVRMVGSAHHDPGTDLTPPIDNRGVVGDELLVGEAHPTKILGLHEKALRILREGLERVVADPAGTAHGSVYLEEIPIAGKTGTAQTSGGPSHAWFAGYVPADKPKYVFVIALEHAGEAAATAGPVAKRLVLRMKQLGMLDR